MAQVNVAGKTKGTILQSVSLVSIMETVWGVTWNSCKLYQSNTQRTLVGEEDGGGQCTASKGVGKTFEDNFLAASDGVSNAWSLGLDINTISLA
jgi:hypothetical protein